MDVPDFLKVLFMEFCLDCEQNHERTEFCEECHACIREYGILDSKEYPLYKCTKCNKVNWYAKADL